MNLPFPNELCHHLFHLCFKTFFLLNHIAVACCIQSEEETTQDHKSRKHAPCLPWDRGSFLTCASSVSLLHNNTRQEIVQKVFPRDDTSMELSVYSHHVRDTLSVPRESGKLRLVNNHLYLLKRAVHCPKKYLPLATYILRSKVSVDMPINMCMCNFS